MQVIYRDVSVDIAGAGSSTQDGTASDVSESESLAGFFKAIALAPLRAVGLCRRPRPPLHALQGLTGRLRPGSSTLILAPPGAGSSMLLRLISARAQCSAGQLLYNGHTGAQLEASGVQLRKLAAYGAATDDHEFLLTVRETLQFAYEAAVVAAPTTGSMPGNGPAPASGAAAGHPNSGKSAAAHIGKLGDQPTATGNSAKSQPLQRNGTSAPTMTPHHREAGSASDRNDSLSTIKSGAGGESERRWTPPDTDAVLAAMGLSHVQHTVIGNALGALQCCQHFAERDARWSPV